MASKSTSSSRQSASAKKRAAKGPATKPAKKSKGASAQRKTPADGGPATPDKAPGKKGASSRPRKTATGRVKAAQAAQAAAQKNARKSARAAARKPPGDDGSRTRSGDEQCVLACHPDVSVLRLIREALAGLADVRVDTAPTAERAFELAMQSEYQLFFFGLTMPEIGGELLYEFIEKAYRHGGSGRFAAPAIAFLASSPEEEKDPQLRRDARVKGVLAPPLRSDRILDLTGKVFGRAAVSR